MSKPKRINNPVKIDFWIDINIKALFEDKFYDAKKLDRGVTRGEFFEQILTAMDGGHEDTNNRKTCT